ncbi:MAG: death-on-curing protein [Alphaproteobacteria bacterium]|nr:death-on-curing protein [Alphaproteobacteria bacterium]
MTQNHCEIILYQASDNQTVLEVRFEDETVWLTQSQMVELFQSTKQNISLHIRNIFLEGELERNSTVKEYLTVQVEGGRKVNRKMAVYNLDVIISVGYRVKSLRGTRFRIWANQVLKDYMLKGYAVNERIDHIEKKLNDHFPNRYSLIPNPFFEC